MICAGSKASIALAAEGGDVTSGGKSRKRVRSLEAGVTWGFIPIASTTFRGLSEISSYERLIAENVVRKRSRVKRWRRTLLVW